MSIEAPHILILAPFTIGVGSEVNSSYAAMFMDKVEHKLRKKKAGTPWSNFMDIKCPPDPKYVFSHLQLLQSFI